MSQTVLPGKKGRQAGRNGVATGEHPPVRTKGSIQSTIALICAGLALAAGIIAIVLAGRPLKVGYVRSGELVYGYAGMKEAQSNYETKKQKWQAELDTLQADYRNALAAYNTQFAGLTAKERQDREAFLTKQEESLRQHSAVLGEKAQEEDGKMTQGVLNQINGMAQQYGKEHGFDLILATTTSGNILYGSDAIDITSDILDLLNRSYNPAAPNGDADSTKH